MSKEVKSIAHEWKEIFDKYLSNTVKDQERGDDNEYELIIPSISVENICMQLCLKQLPRYQYREDGKRECETFWDDEIGEYQMSGDISEGEWCGLAVIHDDRGGALRCHIYLMSQENLQKYSSVYGISNDCTNHLKLWKLLEHDQLAVNHGLHNSLVNILGFWISDGTLVNRSCVQVQHEGKSRELSSKGTKKLLKFIANSRSFGDQEICGKEGLTIAQEAT